MGQGTGLGLSTVYGIIKQTDGYIWVDSEPGVGTAFRIYMPITAVPLPPVLPPPEPPRHGGRECVLVVDDEDLVRATAVRALHEEGYDVLAAESGSTALQLLHQTGQRIRLVVTDMAMGGIDGRELGRRLLELRPELPVLYMSGFPADEMIRRGLLQDHQTFIQKPFAPLALAVAVRGLLDAAGGNEVPAQS